VNTHYTYNAKCTDVYDGDSITVDIDLGFNVILSKQKIRLLGIDTPELRGDEREQGLVVRDYVRDLVLGKELILESHRDKSGKYGRWLGTLYVDDVNINQLLLDENLAKPYPK